MPDARDAAWPPLPLAEWQDAFETLHLWMQIVGKVRLALTPWINHSWHATLYVTASGLTTSPIPWQERSFDITLDFLRHQVDLQSSDGARAGFALEPQSVATFHRRLLEALGTLGVHPRISRRPNEVADPVPFDQDEVHRSYQADAAQRFWRVLVQAQRVFTRFRSGFIGKCSPVHLFWGAADLAVTRFSGRRAPEHPGGIPHLPDWVTREAYSHEVSSAGFWPGGGAVAYPAFYSYAYPEPPGFAQAAVRPGPAFYSTDLREFILPYDAVRTADDPDAALLSFLESTYAAAAGLAGWDRASLERSATPER
jgi:hypothetical protein